MWFVPICVSMPFGVRLLSGSAITPALFISTSQRSYLPGS
jgi:hypothetical protein